MSILPWLLISKLCYTPQILNPKLHGKEMRLTHSRCGSFILYLCQVRSMARFNSFFYSTRLENCKSECARNGAWCKDILYCQDKSYFQRIFNVLGRCITHREWSPCSKITHNVHGKKIIKWNQSNANNSYALLNYGWSYFLFNF